MKTLMSVCLAFALAIPILAWSQDTSQQGSQSQQTQPSTQTQPSAQSQPGTQSQPSTQSQSSTSKPDQNQQQMSGTVSNDDKTFTSDKDNKSYKIDNPDALKGQENQRVTIIVTVNPDTGDLHVIKLVTPAPPQL